MPTLEFTLMVGCPLMCSFCPQEQLRRSYGKAEKYLSFDAFRTILAKVPKHVRIDFSGMAEPWANREATSMLRHTLESGYSMAIYTTLYGMTAADAETVIDLLRAHAVQVERLCLHLPDFSGNMRGWRYDPLYADNLRAFMDLGRSGTLRGFEAMAMDGSGRLHPDLATLGVQTGAWAGHTRAGNLAADAAPGQPLMPAREKHGAVTCAYTPFYDQNVCLPNGDVVLCCMDYALQHRIGNLLRQDYYEIFAGGAIGELVSENMNPRFSERSLCKRCDRAAVLTTAASRQFWQPVQ